MSTYFVTGTGTGTGKTYVTAGIVRAARQGGHKAGAIKPVLSGYDPALREASDPGVLLNAMGKPVSAASIAAISPWRYAAPLAPDMAAAREGRSINFPQVVNFCQAAAEAAPGLMLVEGVGGAMVPLGGWHTVRDWIAALRIPALLVGGSYLGAISHVLTTAEALANRGISITAIVLSESEISPVPLEETAEIIARFLPQIPLHMIPRHRNSLSFQALAETLEA